MKARFHKPMGCPRVCLTPIGAFKDRSRVAAQLLRPALRSKIHPNIFNLNGLGPYVMLERIQRARLNSGAVVLAVDLKEFFHRVDWSRCKSLLRRGGIPKTLATDFGLDFLQSNAQKPHRGLPQGFPTSPWLAGLYITPVLNRMSYRYVTFCYVDNLYFIVPSMRVAKIALKFLRRCLEEHSYPARKLEIHEIGPKRHRAFLPSEPLNVLGFDLGPVGVA